MLAARIAEKEAKGAAKGKGKTLQQEYRSPPGKPSVPATLAPVTRPPVETPGPALRTPAQDWWSSWSADQSWTEEAPWRQTTQDRPPLRETVPGKGKVGKPTTLEPKGKGKGEKRQRSRTPGPASRTPTMSWEAAQRIASGSDIPMRPFPGPQRHAPQEEQWPQYDPRDYEEWERPTGTSTSSGQAPSSSWAYTGWQHESVPPSAAPRPSATDTAVAEPTVAPRYSHPVPKNWRPSIGSEERTPSAAPKPRATPPAKPSASGWTGWGAAAAWGAESWRGAQGATYGKPGSTAVSIYMPKSLVPFLGTPEYSWYWLVRFLVLATILAMLIHYVVWVIRAGIFHARRLRKLGFAAFFKAIAPATQEQGTQCLIADEPLVSDIFLTPSGTVYHNDYRCRYLATSRIVNKYRCCVNCDVNTGHRD